MRIGQRVERRGATGESLGTISRVTHERFRVSYDSRRDEKTGRRIPGGRYWYPRSYIRFFTVAA